MENTLLRKEAITETYNDMQNLVNKVAWLFYERYGGDFEEWRAEANLIFISTYHTYRKNKGMFSTWLYFCIWKKLLTYLNSLHRQIPIASTSSENEDVLKTLEDKTKHSFSPLELLDGIKSDTKILIYLIWQPPEELKKINIKKGSHSCHMKVVLRNYLSKLGWTGKRIKESFEEITELIND